MCSSKNRVEAFFDHLHDPGEMNNLINDPRYASVIADHRAIMADILGVSIFGVEPGTPMSVGTEKPVIQLLGDSEVSIERGTAWDDPGVTANDFSGARDLSPAVRIGGDVVNTSIKGEYVIRYSVKGFAGEISEPMTRTVFVR